MKYTIDTGFGDDLGAARVVIEGEALSALHVREIARELLGWDKEVTQPAIVTVESPKIDTTKPFVPGGILPVIADPAEPKTVLTSTVTYTEHYSVDQVADAVKLVVSKHGVPRAAALLKEFGGARAGDVPAENRAAFIAKASEVAA